MKTATSVSLERLHRLRPSDIEAIRGQSDRKDALAGVVATFARYLADLKDPHEVELDDVIRIALQLKAATVWDRVKPSDFGAVFKDRFDPKIFAALNDALDDSSADAPSAVARTSSSILQVAKRKLSESEPALERRLADDKRHAVAEKRVPEPRRKAPSPVVSQHGSHTQMSKSALIEKIAIATELSKRDVKSIMETLTDVGHKELKKNGLFLVPGFAKFVVVKEPAIKARKGTNPFTGEEVMFKAKPARKIVRAHPVKATRDSA